MTPNEKMHLFCTGAAMQRAYAQAEAREREQRISRVRLLPSLALAVVVFVAGAVVGMM